MRKTFFKCTKCLNLLNDISTQNVLYLFIVINKQKLKKVSVKAVKLKIQPIPQE